MLLSLINYCILFILVLFQFTIVLSAVTIIIRLVSSIPYFFLRFSPKCIWDGMYSEILLLCSLASLVAFCSSQHQYRGLDDNVRFLLLLSPSTFVTKSMEFLPVSQLSARVQRCRACSAFPSFLSHCACSTSQRPLLSIFPNFAFPSYYSRW